MKSLHPNNVRGDANPTRVTVHGFPSTAAGRAARRRTPITSGPPAPVHPLHDRQALLTEGMTLLALAGPDTLARALAALRAL